MDLSKKGLLFCYDFDYLSIIEPYVEEITNIILNYKNRGQIPVDLQLPFEHPLHKIISPQVENIVNTHFFAGKKLQKYVNIAVYLQNNEIFTSKLHDHVSTLGSISGVFYYNLPKEGGEFYYKYLDKEWGEENKIQLQENKIYLFPAWLPHKPLPQQDPSYRLCFNIEYPSNERAIHKSTGVRW